jgi:hypothetical protein
LNTVHVSLILDVTDAFLFHVRRDELEAGGPLRNDEDLKTAVSIFLPEGVDVTNLFVRFLLSELFNAGHHPLKKI